jgi:phenylalanyl-tRNA synthetase alpha chain
MLDRIELAEKNFKTEIESVTDLEKLEEVRIQFLGRKGLFTELFEEFKQLPKEEKPKYGQVLNKTKSFAQKEFDKLKNKFESSKAEQSEYIDLTLAGRDVKLGSKHILTQTLDEIKQIFKGLGFSIYEGPELESDHNNFEMLNFPADHPARDMQDTFFVNDNFLLRTHTSPVQVRLMENKKPPIRALMPGKVYRNEAISAKSYCLFHQVEGLYVDENVTFTELKGTIVAFLKQYFGENVKYRFRPSFFPFTEPSAEVDVWWEQKGKEGRWLEIMGCGMVDPNVLENVKIDNEKYVGYAFGMGVERIAMLKYGVGDIRIFFDNDKRFLEQF